MTHLNQTLGQLIPDRIPANADPRVQNITLYHLLTSTSGWAWDGRINFSRHGETDDLDAMLALCETVDSGRVPLLDHFGQPSGPCVPHSADD